ncbi:DUF4839 domain-containing protein [Georgenia muralis]|uniref:DUF4839 domain-containing protein n=1 Tax=Georgenia muralis TaxID=154117 RepID=UPI001476A43D|nr:DUF4839 domain-containing protein [Georgenia muralis]
MSKWEKEGWEATSQLQGKLHTEITIRRPRPKTPWPLIAIGSGILAALIIAIVVNGIIREQSSAAPPETAADSTSESAPTPGSTPSEEPSPAESARPADVAITPDGNAELAAVLNLGDYCDVSIAAFAEKYRGQTIAFDGHIGVMNSHDGASTRYDILIGAGDFSETSALGPSFQFRDVNTTSDLHYTGETPATIGVGTNLRVTAEVDQYESGSCLFLLKPVETVFR